MKKLQKIKLASVMALGLLVTGCASDPNLMTDILGTLTQTGITAVQAAEIYSAVQANNTGKPITLNSVLSDIGVGATAAQNTGIQEAANALLVSLNKTITDAEAKGASTQAIVAATNAQVVAGQVALQAVAPSTTSTAVIYFNHTGKLFASRD